METLLKRIRLLKKHPVADTIRERKREFSRARNDEELFSELCFCILTANYNAVGGIRIQSQIGDGFCKLPRARLAKRLRMLGHRFPNTRASYVSEARKHLPLKEKLSGIEEKELREWLAKNVKGLGYKEASHFLRNIGYKNIAIIDFHIVDILVKEGLITRPKSLSPKRYLEIERVLSEIGKRAGMDLAELDLYLWYMETGKVLK
jgi:N-glycosylase/DNA lyase